MNCEAIPNCEVMPSESPTVPIADAVSNSDGSNGRFSMRLMIIPPLINSPIYSKKIVAALFTVSSDMRRLKKCVSSFLRNTDSADETKTAIGWFSYRQPLNRANRRSPSTILSAFDLSH